MGFVPRLQVSDGLCLLLEWCMSIAGPRGLVERNLGRMTAVLSVHTGGMDYDGGRHLNALTESDMDGPTCETDWLELEPVASSLRHTRAATRTA